MIRVEINIDELVLNGVPPEYADGLSEQFEHELRQLALDHAPGGLADSVRGTVRLTSAQVAVTDGAGLARQTAAGVWAAVTRGATLNADGGF